MELRQPRWDHKGASMKRAARAEDGRAPGVERAGFLIPPLGAVLGPEGHPRLGACMRTSKPH